MQHKEATARININKLLEEAGWRFFAEAKCPANIQLEAKVAITTQDLDTPW
jgi:type I restriction enzyme R subunit